MYRQRHDDVPLSLLAAGPGSLPGARTILLAAVFVLHALIGDAGAGILTETEQTAPEASSWPGPLPPPEPVRCVEPRPWPGPLPPPEPFPRLESAPLPGPLPWQPLPCAEAAPPGFMENFGNVLEETHASLQRNFLRQTVRFDNYLGSSKPEQNLETGYDLRWRNSLRLEHGNDVTFGTTFLANISLSRVSERLHLFIAAENEPALPTRTLPQDPGYPGFDRTVPSTHFANTELRYELIRRPDLNLFAGAGFRFALPVDVFARTRLQYTRNIDDLFVMRTAQTVYVKSNDFLGETTEFSLERLVARYTLLRWASAATASEKIEGVEWGSVLSLFRQLSPKNSVTLLGGVYSNTTHSELLQNYQVLARYRQNFFKKWLFFEIEPQIFWPKRLGSDYHPAIFTAIFRIEVMFRDSTANGNIESSVVDKQLRSLTR